LVVKPSSGIYNDTGGTFPSNAPHSKLRIVSDDGARPDNYGVNMSTNAMKVI
jgi:hypothetical protein